MRIGVIGGSGLYEMDGLTQVREECVSTPFGEPSDAYILGRLGEHELVFLPRHGRGHRYNPTEVPYRANIFGMRSLGVEWVISLSAVGSLREEIVPGHVVIIDQFIDRTWQRASTFFEKGIVAHVSFGDPVCPTLRGFLLEAAREAGASVHDRGTYVCMEGPVFSTRAESELHRSWGASVVGMTNLPEAKLAREAGISYATIALATDYDCWHPGHEQVSVDQVVAVLQANVELARRIVKLAVPRIAGFPGEAPMKNALRHAIMTRPDLIPEERKRALEILLRNAIG
jgi:5'-methylthioadenosine phosphorylase